MEQELNCRSYVYRNIGDSGSRDEYFISNAAFHGHVAAGEDLQSTRLRTQRK